MAARLPLALEARAVSAKRSVLATMALRKILAATLGVAPKS
jgi:hypothetical protein